MLVLSRMRDEVIRIGDELTITVIDIRGDKVRLGIEAPRDVPVHRQEVYEAIQREERERRNAGTILEVDAGRVRGGQEPSAVHNPEAVLQDAAGSASVLPRSDVPYSDLPQ